MNVTRLVRTAHPTFGTGENARWRVCRAHHFKRFNGLSVIAKERARIKLDKSIHEGPL